MDLITNEQEFGDATGKVGSAIAAQRHAARRSHPSAVPCALAQHRQENE
jgi:hypothetical protein